MPGISSLARRLLNSQLNSRSRSHQCRCSQKQKCVQCHWCVRRTRKASTFLDPQQQWHLSMSLSDSWCTRSCSKLCQNRFLVGMANMSPHLQHGSQLQERDLPCQNKVLECRSSAFSASLTLTLEAKITIAREDACLSRINSIGVSWARLTSAAGHGAILC